MSLNCRVASILVLAALVTWTTVVHADCDSSATAEATNLHYPGFSCEEATANAEGSLTSYHYRNACKTLLGLAELPDTVESATVLECWDAAPSTGVYVNVSICCDGDVAPAFDFSVSTDTTTGTGLGFLEDAAGFAFGQAIETVSTEMLVAMVGECRDYPPAAEPATVDLFTRMTQTGEVAPVFYADGGHSRVWGYKADTEVVGHELAHVIQQREGVSLKSADGHELTHTVQQNGAQLRAGNFETLSPLYVSPLIVDLSGVGVPDVSGTAAAPHPFAFSMEYVTVFDIDGDGYLEATEWVGPDAGLLVSPADTETEVVENEDGDLIWNGPLTGADLIGTVGGYRNGFEKLTTFDMDGDGLVAGDELHSIYVWTDADGDALPDPTELSRPEELGVAELRLAHEGIAGSYVDDTGAVLPMWDWWPSYFEIREDSESDPEDGCGDVGKINGAITDTWSADLQITFTPETLDSQNRFIPEDILSEHGFNGDGALLAKVSNNGDQFAVVDYALTAPHLARIWLFEAGNHGTYSLHRFSLPASLGKHVEFSQNGKELWIVTEQSRQVYWIGPATKKSIRQISSIRLGADSGFQMAFGAPFVQGDHFYLPGYFSNDEGKPTCDAVAKLQVNKNKVTLTPAGDVHWLMGDDVTAAGYGEVIGFWLASAAHSFVTVVHPTDGVAVLALRCDGESAGEGVCAIDDRVIVELDRAPAIGGLYAIDDKIAYTVTTEEGFETRFATMDVAEPSAVVPSAALPSYPQLSNNGERMTWMVFDWELGSAAVHGFNLGDPETDTFVLAAFDQMPGAVRSARNRAITVLQTRDGFIVSSSK